ncbi:MAG TPA: trypsin-like peptidase domain-containing protein [Gemmatimonadales bacterium]|jgi:serine protease Do|nr:trypsin-like peptidase domain-containing protein [Gemmatimonadales bacterium]
MSARSLNWLKFGGLVALAFALGLLFAGLLNLPHASDAQEPARQAIAPVEAPSIPEAKPLEQLSQAFAAVADVVTPSVVYIQSQRTERNAGRRLPPGMEQFFGRPLRQQPQIERGSGSGFIVSTDGYILTNNHVIANSDLIKVRLRDNRQFNARLVGTDPNTDVAVLKIDATGLKPVALGNSDDERIGEWVLAIGNPLGEGLTFTVTSGIISAKGRALNALLPEGTGISDFIQTDAAINPGNSGGPLVNVKGEVIGINSAIASETGFYSGYGFAIPINLVKNVMNQLITTGTVHRAALGVGIRDATREDAAYVGMDQIRGVLVSTITEASSPAAKAGIEPGDVIISLDGKPVDRVGQLQQEVGFRKPGDVVKVEVARKGGVRKTYSVRLEALPDSDLASAPSDTTADDDGDGAGGTAPAAMMNLLGVSVQSVTPALAQQLGVPRTTRGVMVTDIAPGGPAYDLNLVTPAQGRGAADIIETVEGKPVRTEAELRAALKSAGAGHIVTLGIQRVFANRKPDHFVERVRLGEP